MSGRHRVDLAGHRYHRHRHDMKQHRLQYPNEVDDASGFIISGLYFFWVPVLFFLSLILARIGVFIVRRNKPKLCCLTTPNKSLDASGDSVLRNLIGPAMLE